VEFFTSRCVLLQTPAPALHLPVCADALLATISVLANALFLRTQHRLTFLISAAAAYRPVPIITERHQCLAALVPFGNLCALLLLPPLRTACDVLRAL